MPKFNVARIFGFVALIASVSAVRAQEPASEPPSLEALSQGLLEATGAPGFGVLVMKNGEIVQQAAVGERAIGTSVSVETDDIWHIGSITKSATASLIARLVDQGALRWDTSVEEALGNEIEDIDPAFRSITFRELLTHRSGLAANLDREQFSQFALLSEDPRADRLEYARQMLQAEPAHAPRETHAYSNAGYVVAGAMVEALLDETWGNLLAREVFGALNLTSAGFGPPGSVDDIDQPRGHRKGEDDEERVAVVPNSKGSDNPAVLGPAGTVHMSLRDLGTFGTAISSGLSPDGERFVSEESLTSLQTPALKNYAMGLVVRAGGALLWHNGSNGTNYAEIYIIPSENFVIVMVANDYDATALSPAFRRLAQTLIKNRRNQQLQP